ncbi:FAD-dependent oxidoreductase [Coleofasciculus sp. A1-SPW-01]|uniref:FAD-dependent oxidoreductase n=1 Tax=Coleofasciculus sp. A1-SPW-01 TaxID=3070819 RepID=UPI004062D3BC
MIAVNELTTEVLVVGGGTGGTSAAIQAARRGVKTILVSEFSWLGGMLTTAGVCAPDGNELGAWQTGLWGAFLRELQQRQPGGLDNGWVSLFTYHPRIGAQIFTDWVQALPNLKWIAGQTPLAVLKAGDCVTGVQFSDVVIHAKVILDATELGDVLELAEIPYHWGWELRSRFGEPSAPISGNDLTQRYPVQAPTWVVILKDFDTDTAPEIPPPPEYKPEQFFGAWEGYGVESFLNYGRLPGGLFMLNWPQCGNDYGEGVGRLVESDASRQQFLQEARWHSQGFACFIQSQLGRRYGLAHDMFPEASVGGGAYALHPYYRESRRLVGMVTLREQEILPITGGQVAPLPVNESGNFTGIAVGNYANDHHYPGFTFPLAPKSIRWGGRWTGTPFTIPYGCLVPMSMDGLLVCDKNISVSHIANGSTRLQPVVMNLGQAAGMAAALCVELGCQPRELVVRRIQEALLGDTIAPAAVMPLFDKSLDDPDWRYWQRYYLDHPEEYPSSGMVEELGELGEQGEMVENFPNHQSPIANHQSLITNRQSCTLIYFTGIFQRRADQDYMITLSEPENLMGQIWILITIQPDVNQQLQHYPHQQQLQGWGCCNPGGNWLLVNRLH